MTEPIALVPTRGRVPVVATFAEAFPITGTRLIVTAISEKWARTAGEVFTGYATSVIACDMEAAVERFIPPEETPDGRPGVSLLAFGMSRDKLAKAVVNRAGQCLLTCPTTACYDGIVGGDPEKRIALGNALRYFGDGHQMSKVIDGRRLWRVPVMDGEFLCEDQLGTVKGVAGGNLIFGGRRQAEVLAVAEAMVEAMRALPGVALPFPGGIVRSGSKIGSKYKALIASTNEAYCPTLAGVVETALFPGTNCVYELVIDGLSLDAVEKAMAAGLAVGIDAPALTFLTAGNYGGKLGPYPIHLAALLTKTLAP